MRLRPPHDPAPPRAASGSRTLCVGIPISVRRTVDRPARETLPALVQPEIPGWTHVEMLSLPPADATCGHRGEGDSFPAQSTAPAHEGSEGGFGTKLLNTHGL